MIYYNEAFVNSMIGGLHPMRNVKGLIFDFGNTLIYFDGEWDEIISEGAKDLASFLKEKGFVFDADAFVEAFLERRRLSYEKARLKWVEYTAEDLLRLTLADFGYKDVDSDTIVRGIEAFFAREEKRWLAYPDVHEVLRGFSKMGYRLGLVSNASDDAVIQRLVRRLGLRRWLSPVISSAGVGIRKPDPLIFKMVLKEWNLLPKEVVMIGDDLETDILGAKLTGMRSVLVKTEDKPLEASDIVPDACIGRLSELPTIIAGLCNP
jgi:putative hydrolase of the HAD superfamily